MTSEQMITIIKELCSEVIDKDFEPLSLGGTGKIELWDSGDGIYIGKWTHSDTQPTVEQLEE